SEVVFTGGGTEADNLAIKGLYWSRSSADPARRRILTSAVEHHAVLDTVQWLADAQGAEVEWLPVDHLGRVNPDEVRRRIARDPGSVALVSLMWANNEVGTVQPVAEVAAIARSYGIPVHTDAVQAIGQLPVDFAAVGVDAMTVTGHKVGGPTGIGALVVRREADLTPLLHGGGQERDLRSGTLDTVAIAGFAAALAEAVDEQPEQSKRLGALRDELIDRLLAVVPDARLGGDPEERLPGNAHVAFPGCEGDALLLLLDAQHIACSTGSACSAGVSQPSHVLLAMGYDDRSARGSLRFSLGHSSTAEDIDALVEAIGPAVERARAAGFTS
ncbi:MAG TPA: cysteine desulfurase family protein, partial [Actinopolymorphaceae bacterium]